MLINCLEKIGEIGVEGNGAQEEIDGERHMDTCEIDKNIVRDMEGKEAGADSTCV